MAEDTLYVTLDGGELSAVDPETFDVRWEFPAEDEVACGNEEPKKRDLRGIYAAPVVSEGTVYFGAWDGNVYALEAASGDCLWDFETNDPIIGGLALAGGRLFAASTDGTVYGIDPATGEETGRAPGGDVWTRPELIGDKIFVADVGGTMHAFDVATLEEEWKFKVNAGFLTDPVALNGTLVAGGIGERLYGVDAATGEELWSFGGGTNWFWGRPLADGDAVYATNLDSRVFAIDAATGERLWQFDAAAPIRAGAVIAAGVLIAVDKDGDVYGLDPQSGAEVWNGPTEIDKEVLADPYVLADGSVLIVTTGGDTFTVSPEDGRLTTVDIR